jgi:O-antigen/teichoic acid export membrane protein
MVITFIKSILNIRRNKDNGYSSVAIKNSFFDFSTSITSRVGSLLFTVLMARILLPELFGLYSLALSTILLFSGLSEFGLGKTAIRFISREISKNKPSKAKAYSDYLFKIRFFISLLISLVLIISAKFLAENYFNKPILLALVTGSLYLFFISMVSFIQSFFQSINNFKVIFYRELIFQFLRLFLVPLVVLYLLKISVSSDVLIATVIGILGVLWMFIFFLMFFNAKRSVPFLREKSKSLLGQEKSKLKKFILALSIFGFSGLFFSYIDIIFLGRFVSSEFIAYYQVALGLINSLSLFVIFGNSLFPIFSRLKGKRLEKGFSKTLKIIFILSLVISLVSFIAAPPVLNLVYGKEYLPATNVFRILILVLFSTPLISLYTSYYIAKGNLKRVSKFLIISTVANIFLNYFFIKFGLKYNEFYAIIGAGFATIISQYYYLFMLYLGRKNLFSNRKIKKMEK